MAVLGTRAVVLGASIGGLLAARVLADFYRTVEVLERDDPPAEPVNRRGVPQGRHCHLLNPRGSQIIEGLFPGLLDELLTAGVEVWNDGQLSRMHISLAGHRMTPAGRWPSTEPPAFYFPSRPLLEWAVRRRLQAMPNVTIRGGHDVMGLTSTTDRQRVTGVRVTDRRAGREINVTADLVLDATGRGSRTPMFLAQLGYPRPREDEVSVQLAYVSQALRMPRSTVSENLIAIFPEPGRPRTWALIGHENDTWIWCMASLAGHYPPPQDRTEMLALGADFAPAHALEAVRSAEPLGPISRYRLPSNRWRRYDKLRRTPTGLVVLGDAISSFNPIYGQGMALAGIQATVLRDCLDRGERNLPRRFYRASARHIRVAWLMAVASDLALPEVPGPRPMSVRLTNVYLDRVLAAIESDLSVSHQFMRVIGMLDHPVSLLRPPCVLRVWRAGHRRHTPRRRGAEAVGSPVQEVDCN